MDQVRAKVLYEKYGFLIYDRCLKILRSEEEAKDAMHEVFLKFLDKIDTLNDPSHIIPWIYTVSKNYCFNLLRAKKKFSSQDVEFQADRKNNEIKLEDKLLIQKILSFHNKKVQDAVYYTYIEKLNQKEIQKVTGQSPATVRRNLNHFKRSIPNLRKRLEIV